MAHHNITFSIITPTYKRSELLERAIKSVVAQTYPNWEMVIVNDDPTSEETLRTLQEYTIRDTRVVAIENVINIGANLSRNRALGTAIGDYIVFLDDDDSLTPNALQDMYDILQQDPHRHWIFSNRITPTGEKITRVRQYNQEYSFLKDYLLGTKIRGDGTHCISRTLVQDVRFPTDIKNGGEWELFAKLHEHMYAYDYPSTICSYLNTGLTNQLSIDCIFYTINLDVC